MLWHRGVGFFFATWCAVPLLAKFTAHTSAALIAMVAIPTAMATKKSRKAPAGPAGPAMIGSNETS